LLYTGWGGGEGRGKKEERGRGVKRGKEALTSEQSEKGKFALNAYIKKEGGDPAHDREKIVRQRGKFQSLGTEGKDFVPWEEELYEETSEGRKKKSEMRPG